MAEQYWLERAWLGASSGEQVHDAVLVTVAGGRFTDVRTGVAAVPPDASRLAGLTLPGLANCHSHAFHRALRGRTQRERGTFWTWREQMYAAADRLDPDRYHGLARAAYEEMAAGGITAVGEFHYLHHDRDGRRYADPNAMGHALVQAARDAGVRLTLLDTCYLSAGFGAPPEGAQLRYSDGDADRWAHRVTRLHDELAGADDVVVGAAIHSVRAVPREQLRPVVAWAESVDAPLHVHLSEQQAENDGCEAAYGLTPTAVLHQAGALGPRTTAVHATHLTDADIDLLGDTRTRACFCPTTERDLGDGIGPSRRLAEAGAPLTLGSDSHAVIDLFEEMRAVELDERLASRRRGHWAAGELLAAATGTGQASLGFPDAGVIAPGARADLVTVDTRTLRTAGTGADTGTLVFAATAADVVHVVSGGRRLDLDRAATAGRLDDAVRALLDRPAPVRPPGPTPQETPR
ncbi:MAG TPA: formimidoylglutamate deiminase [Nocardioidaceae bacterium]|nr:formimidoylglutamate deiminase [Nocardioidaceae bacterium]